MLIKAPKYCITNSLKIKEKYDKILEKIEKEEKMKKIIFFDLDGTIVDSKPGIIESVKYALKHFGIEETNEEKLNLFIGPPLFDAFSKYYNMNKEDADLAVAKYRENYNGNRAVLKYSVYEGIKEAEYPQNNGYIAKNLEEALRKMNEIITKYSVVLFANDLPDNYL